jgi:hypothetical protein
MSRTAKLGGRQPEVLKQIGVLDGGLKASRRRGRHGFGAIWDK